MEKSIIFEGVCSSFSQFAIHIIFVFFLFSTVLLLLVDLQITTPNRTHRDIKVGGEANLYRKIMLNKGKIAWQCARKLRKTHDYFLSRSPPPFMIHRHAIGDLIYFSRCTQQATNSRQTFFLLLFGAKFPRFFAWWKSFRYTTTGWRRKSPKNSREAHFAVNEINFQCKNFLLFAVA